MLSSGTAKRIPEGVATHSFVQPLFYQAGVILGPYYTFLVQ